MTEKVDEGMESNGVGIVSEDDILRVNIAKSYVSNAILLALAEQAGIDLFRYRYHSDVDGAIEELRDRFYPGAWEFAVRDGLDRVVSFSVEVKTPAELALAYALKPDGITAEVQKLY